MRVTASWIHLSGMSLLFLAACCLPAWLGAEPTDIGADVSLDGTWDAGEGRSYTRNAPVPGLAQDPAKASPGTLWYRRSVTLPGGDWTRATLTLKGARFAPVVYVNGKQVSSVEGGMAPTVHLLASPDVVPGRTIQLEIALKSLNDVDPLDASATPGADRWRSNISSGLWDSVVLHFSGGTRVARVTPWTDFEKRSVDVHWTLDPASSAGGSRWVQAAILDDGGRVLAESLAVPAASSSGVAHLKLGPEILPWSPETPALYRLRVSVSEGAKVTDRATTTWGLRELKVAGLGFQLNGHPAHLRAATVVFPRMLRDPEAKILAFDTAWFEREIGARLHALGANTIRFHLGLPPDAWLDYCDRTGFMVQMEWSFFHGVAASPESMRTQWREWIDVAMRHPCVVLLHPWNETEGEQLKKAQAAIAAITKDYPPLVIAHRDVLHIHKYWWSLFENLGLYYDAPTDFDRPIMADEFGGDYLDRQGNPGGYPTTRETFLRFLGRGNTEEQRLRFHAEANARVAEYWRRLGAAGFSPFCVIGSLQDGNSWFLGSLARPKPMPVWAALSAAYAPQSVSLAIWNRNFTPGEKVEVPLYFFNDLGGTAKLDAAVRIVSLDGTSEKVVSEQKISADVPAYSTSIKTASFQMPAVAGNWRLEAELLTPVTGVTVQVKSDWRCRTLAVTTPAVLRGMVVGVPAGETELRAMLARNGVRVTGIDDRAARSLVLSLRSWPELVKSSVLRDQLGAALKRGQSVVLLDIGPRDLERYQQSARRNLDGAPSLGQPKTEDCPLFAGIDVVFREAIEPESHLQPSLESDLLWQSLPREATWLWNGLRGGLIVPPYEMDVRGLSASALAGLWTGRGADAKMLAAGTAYYAYELAGYYAFSDRPKDAAATAALRKKVKFLADDAPSLQGRVDPDGPITTTDLAAAMRDVSKTGGAGEMTPLANAGKSLTRTPVVMLSFGAGRGRVALSQLLTAGRLNPDDHPLKLYELGYDPAAEQLVLNLIALAAK